MKTERERIIATMTRGFKDQKRKKRPIATLYVYFGLKVEVYRDW